MTGWIDGNPATFALTCLGLLIAIERFWT